MPHILVTCRGNPLQAVLFESLRQLCLAVAPIVPFTADDIFQHSMTLLTTIGEGGGDGHDKEGEAVDLFTHPVSKACVFDVSWPIADARWLSPDVADCWSTVLEVQSRVRCDCLGR